MSSSPDPVRRKILFLVFALHALFLLAILANPTLNVKPKRKPLLVKTVIPIPPKPITTTQRPLAAQSAKPKPTPIKSAPPKPKTQPPPKPAPKKEPAIADKKLTTSKQPVKQEPKPQPRAKISDALKKELEESLAKLNAPEKKSISKQQSQTIRPHTLQIDQIDASHHESEYPGILAAVLYEALKLPELGEVQIQLTLQQDGTVVKLNVLKTESQKNKAYLETHLPHIRCPRFEGAYSKKKEHTFTLTFCNE